MKPYSRSGPAFQKCQGCSLRYETWRELQTELQQVAIRLSGFTVCTLDIAFRFEKSSGEQNLGQSEILVERNHLSDLGWDELPPRFRMDNLLQTPHHTCLCAVGHSGKSKLLGALQTGHNSVLCQEQLHGG